LPFWWNKKNGRHASLPKLIKNLEEKYEDFSTT
jgi:hypothetical protein